MSELDKKFDIFPVKELSSDIYFGSNKNIFDFHIPSENGLSLIDYAVSDCGCSDPRLFDDKIRVLYNNSDSAPKAGAEKVIITKTSTVYFRDGKPNFVHDPNTGEQIPNPKKASTVLVMKITVVS